MTSQQQQYATRRSLAACISPPPPPPRKETTKEIQERSLKHIAGITKDLAPPQSEELTYEQQQWLRQKMGLPMPKPYKIRGEVEIPYKWIEDTKT